MSKKVLMKGNIAMSQAAIMAGCRFYAGYPITPQNEVPTYMSSEMPKAGGTFIQAESETAAINMVFGAAAAGARSMTTTSSPGYSLMQEGVSYLAGARLPCVLANVQRGGPGLGNIAGAQSDYFQATKGGGHGDYHVIVLAPSDPQEMMDFTLDAFDLADKYLMPVLILSDGTVGQMMEAVEIPENYQPDIKPKTWALTGCKDREKNVVRSLWLDDTGVHANNVYLQKKYVTINENEVRFENYQADDAEVVFVSYGLPSRICRKVVDDYRKQGKKVGMLRPITLYPYPYKEIERLITKGVKSFFVIEQSAGQMVEDVRLGVNGKVPVNFFGTLGGRTHGENELKEKLDKVIKGEEVYHVFD